MISLTVRERKALAGYLELASCTLRQTVDGRYSDLLPSVVDMFHAWSDECDTLRAKILKGS
jgi:hypothetical protein